MVTRLTVLTNDVGRKNNKAGLFRNNANPPVAFLWGPEQLTTDHRKQTKWSILRPKQDMAIIYVYIYIYICIYICYYQGEPTGSNSKEVRAHGHWHFAVVVRAYDSDWWAQRINRMIQLEKMQMQSVIIGCDTHRMMMRTLLLTKNIMVFVYYYVNY